jgi:hypothetical protein
LKFSTVLQKITTFGNESIQLIKMWSDILCKNGNLHTHTHTQTQSRGGGGERDRMLCEDRDRDQGDTSKCHLSEKKKEENNLLRLLTSITMTIHSVVNDTLVLVICYVSSSKTKEILIKICLTNHSY